MGIPVKPKYATRSFISLLLNMFSLFPTVDDVPPVVACLENISEDTPIGSGGRIVSWIAPTATDNSGIVNLSSRTRAPGSYFLVGNSDVTYEFVDGAGNTASCVFTVTVVEGEYYK